VDLVYPHSGGTDCWVMAVTSAARMDMTMLDIPESFLDALPGQIALLDRSGTIRVVNQAWQDFAPANAYAGTGFGIGSNYPRLCLADGGAYGLAIARGVRTVLARNVPQFTYEFPCRIDGQEHWFRLTATARGDDRAQGVVIMHLDITSSFARDITEQKHVAIALRRSEAQFRAMCDASPIGIFLTEPDGYSVYANAMNLAQMGLTAEEALGDGWQRAIHPDDREHVFTTFATAVRQGTMYEGVNRYLHADAPSYGSTSRRQLCEMAQRCSPSWEWLKISPSARRQKWRSANTPTSSNSCRAGWWNCRRQNAARSLASSTIKSARCSQG